MGEPALIERLSDDKKDERTGIEAIRGFTFQVWWATCRALELLKTEEDFVVVLEYKQDVAIIDKADNPTRLVFYQIKKNEGLSATPWSVNELMAQDKEAKKTPSSVLGKLFQHRPRFPKTPVALAFVSNTGFSYSNPKVECEAIALADLPTDVADKIKEAIAKDVGGLPAEVDLSNFRLERTLMPPELQHRWAGGILDEVEKAAVLPFSVPNKGATAQILAAEFLARAGKRAFARDFAKLLERGMTRAQLVQLLMDHSDVVRESAKTVAESICERLDRENYNWKAVQGMREQIPRACVDLTNRNHPTLAELANRCVQGREACSAAAGPLLGDDINAVVKWLEATHHAAVSRYNKGYLHLIVALTLRDAHELRVLTSPSDSK